MLHFCWMPSRASGYVYCWCRRYTVESRYVKLGLVEILIKSKFVCRPVLNLVLFNLLNSCYLKF